MLDRLAWIGSLQFEIGCSNRQPNFISMLLDLLDNANNNNTQTKKYPNHLADIFSSLHIVHLFNLLFCAFSNCTSRMHEFMCMNVRTLSSVLLSTKNVQICTCTEQPYGMHSIAHTIAKRRRRKRAHGEHFLAQHFWQWKSWCAICWFSNYFQQQQQAFLLTEKFLAIFVCVWIFSLNLHRIYPGILFRKIIVSCDFVIWSFAPFPSPSRGALSLSLSRPFNDLFCCFFLHFQAMPDNNNDGRKFERVPCMRASVQIYKIV